MALEPELIDNRMDAREIPPTVNLEELRRLSRLMDSAFEIPGVRLKFGLDAILGLFPGLGDLVSSAMALYILQSAARHGVSRVVMARMGFNILIDWLFGSIPILGDAFDIYWKSNHRNVALLESHLDANPAARRRARRSDWLFLTLLIAVLLICLAGILALSWFTVALIARWLFPTAAA